MDNEELPEYDEFKTGLTFRDVYNQLKAEQNKKYSEGEYMFITRHTVLGRWREIKLQMYSHLEDCYYNYRNRAAAN